MNQTTIIASIKLPCAMNALAAILKALAAEYEGQKLFVRYDDNCFVVFKEN